MAAFGATASRVVTASCPLCSNSDGWLDDHYKGALPPGSIGNRSVVPLIAFLLSLEANRPRCHQLPKCERRNGLMGLSLIEPLVLKEEQ